MFLNYICSSLYIFKFSGVKTPEELEQYLKDKHGAKAAAKGMEVSDYLNEQQARRKEKYGKGGKTQANRGDSSDSSEDSEGWK